jgi:peroxiredoxin Q/BCP
MRVLSCVSAVAVALALLVPAVRAAELKIGDKAPTIEATDDSGKTWKSSDVVGKKVLVIYFYPANFTGGCTKQACSFRDEMGKLKDKDVEVVGVSGDSPKGHEEFKKFHKLNFSLLSDEEGAIASKFGVPFSKGEKTVQTTDASGNKLELKRKVTINRWTFVVGKDGKIADKKTDVVPIEDSKRILDILKELKEK